MRGKEGEERDVKEKEVGPSSVWDAEPVAEVPA